MSNERNFDLLVLGSSGGPLEGHTSSFILKPSSISFKDIVVQKLNNCLIAIDAGAGLGKLAELIVDDKQNKLDKVTELVLSLYSDSITMEEANRYQIPSTSLLGLSDLQESPIELAHTLSDLTKTQLISHPHMDHIASLAINSPAFGFESGKVIYGLKETIQALSSSIFNDTVWPELTSSDNGRFLTLQELKSGEETEISPLYKITPYQLNHGCTTAFNHAYHSTTHLIEHNSKHILVFGDVESDADSIGQPNLNLAVWQSVSKLISNRTLNSIVIECSTPNQPPNMPLYGHLNPDALIKELVILSNLVKSHLDEDDERFNQPLKGIDILITHVKDRRHPIDPKKVIIQELNQLNEKLHLGCHFTILLAGQVYTLR